MICQVSSSEHASRFSRVYMVVCDLVFVVYIDHVVVVCCDSCCCCACDDHGNILG